MADKQQNIKETFIPKQGGQSHTKVEQIVTDLEKSHITHTNFERYNDLLDGTVNIIEGQLENLFTNYQEESKSYTEAMSQERVKQRIEDNKIVPLEIHTSMRKLSFLLKESLSWEILQTKMMHIIIKKLFSALKEAKAYEIKRDALKEMREMENARNKLFADLMVQRNDTHLKSLEILHRQQQVDMRENVKILADAITEMSRNHAGALKVLSEAIGKQLTPDEIDNWKKEFEKNTRATIAEKTIMKQTNDNAEFETFIKEEKEKSFLLPELPAEKPEARKKKEDVFADTEQGDLFGDDTEE